MEARRKEAESFKSKRKKDIAVVLISKEHRIKWLKMTVDLLVGEVGRGFFKCQLLVWMCGIHSLEPAQNQQKLNQLFEHPQWGRHYHYAVLENNLFIEKEPWWCFPTGFRPQASNSHAGHCATPCEQWPYYDDSNDPCARLFIWQLSVQISEWSPFATTSCRYVTSTCPHDSF